MKKHIYDTVVVGGGMAGLTATAYLARAGKKVLLIEKNNELGGLVSSFSRDGFLFDAGVRALESAGIILPMLEELNIRLEVVKSPVSVGIEDQILAVEGIESLNEYRDLLKQIYPGSSAEIDAVIHTIRKIMKHMDVLYGIENPLFKDLVHDRDFIFKKLLPWLPRFLLTIGKINRMAYPVEDYLSSALSDPSLRDIISQHFFKGTPTFFAMSYFSLYLDYFYPKGGVSKLAEALRDKILELGGEIRTGCTVTQVSVDNHTGTDHLQRSYSYNKLIWAADLKTLYRSADCSRQTAGVHSRIDAVKTKMLQNRGTDSVFTTFLQVDEAPQSFAAIANGHFFYTPSRQGLGETHRRELQELLNKFDSLSKSDILAWLDKFISLNTFEISIPVLKDPDTAPPGKTGVIVSFLAEYELFKKVEEAGWLDEFVTQIEDRVIRVLSESVYPMLSDKVLKRWSYSPLSIQNRVASSEGAIVGWEFQTQMPVVNQIQKAASSVLTPLPSVYQAGQWAYSPAGVPMAILTGRIAANIALKANIPAISIDVSSIRKRRS